MNQIINIILSLLGALRDRGLIDSAKLTAEAYRELIAEVTDKNPKPDGTSWTREELDAIGDEAIAIAEGTKRKLAVEPGLGDPEE